GIALSAPGSAAIEVGPAPLEPQTVEPLRPCSSSQVCFISSDCFAHWLCVMQVRSKLASVPTRTLFLQTCGSGLLAAAIGERLMGAGVWPGRVQFTTPSATCGRLPLASRDLPNVACWTIRSHV